MRLRLDRMASPVGELRIVFDEAGRLRALDFEGYDARNDALLRRHYGTVELVEGRAPESIRGPLKAYFDGDLESISSIPTETGGTDFQRAAWAALRTIPAGQTRSYKAQAAAIGKPAATRAIGRANGDNPICIVNPCHRVIGADGGLTGFGGGLERKRWLLAHEGALAGA
jgi:methylated-DNA-[protein]-cysteine S-methyltransferase